MYTTQTGQNPCNPVSAVCSTGTPALLLRLPHRPPAYLAWLVCSALMAPQAFAQNSDPMPEQVPAPAASEAWRQCAATPDSGARLACFDHWAQHQPAPAAAPSAWQAPAASARQAAIALPASASAPTPAAEPARTAAGTGLAHASNGGCRDPRYSEMSRFYELEAGTDCGTFSFRGYKPLTVSVTTGNNINQQPSSPSHPTAAFTPYDRQELRIQLSARTKIASGLLTQHGSGVKDALWVGYTQQSFWQVFNADLSRPFRTTDHEPEIFYVYPTTARLPLGWTLRYSGAGLVHHSNGQSDPLSRSWNRWYIMAGAELDDRWQLQAKLAKRIAENPANDDNPGIQNYWGRAEVKLLWQPNAANTLGLTARGSLGKGYGSARLEWMRTLGEGWNGGKSNLRLHVQLFSGYGESLIDYNHKRTSLSVGLSLLDF